MPTPVPPALKLNPVLLLHKSVLKELNGSSQLIRVLKKPDSSATSKPIDGS